MHAFAIFPLVRRALWVGVLAGLAWPAQGAIKDSAPDGFTMEWSDTVAAPPERVYAALAQWGQWWNAEHSYSQDGANFSLEAVAGSCLCERWKGGSVEHGRVLMALPNQVLRLDAPFGPLQGAAVKAILTFKLEPSAAGTHLATTYRVSGSSGSTLDKSAPGVHEVLSEAWERLGRFAVTGKP